MHLKGKFRMLCMRGFLCLFFVASVGCISSLDTYQGKTANQNSRIALQGGSHNGVWQTDDLTINYKYFRKPNNLQIAGDVALSTKLTDASDIVKEFALQINFLDAAGRALGTKELVIAGFRESLTKWDFDYNFELPAKTAAIAFSYDGQMGAGLVGAEEFWYDPFQ